MKRKRSTRFAPIYKIEPVSGMVAGDRRKMVEAHRQAMAREDFARMVMLAQCAEALQLLRALADCGGPMPMATADS